MKLTIMNVLSIKAVIALYIQKLIFKKQFIEELEIFVFFNLHS